MLTDIKAEKMIGNGLRAGDRQAGGGYRNQPRETAADPGRRGAQQ